jgi:heat shock protein 1/8
MIGDTAKNAAHKNVKNTVYNTKRLIGRKFSDEAVQADIKHWPFKVEADEETGKPLIVV